MPATSMIPVLTLSVEAIPVSVDPSPTKLVAVTIPVTSIPDSLDVTADPTDVWSLIVALVNARSPVFELNVRFVPVLSAWSPDAAVANVGKQVVSLLSSESAEVVD